MKEGKEKWFRAFFDADYVALLKDQFSAEQTAAQARFVVRALRLRPGLRVLDVPCGYGRHAAELAKRGMEVVGVDLSPSMIREARRAYGRRQGLRFLRGDMRHLAFRGEFDAVICMFTSFGYFSDAVNRDVLARMVRALRKGGGVLIDHRNPEGHRGRGSDKFWWKVGRSRYVMERHRFDPGTGVSDSRWTIVQPGSRRIIRKRFLITFYSVAQWRGMLSRCGARPVAFWGDYRFVRPRPALPRLIVVARR